MTATITDNRLEVRCLSSLVKVFADEDLSASEYIRGSAFNNETFSFQVAYTSSTTIRDITVNVESALAERINVRRVGLVPSEFPVKDASEEDVLRTTPGLYPDPLIDLVKGEGITSIKGQWRSLWITVELNGSQTAGSHPIHIHLNLPEGQCLARTVFTLDILPIALPEQQLIRTEWIHYDCLSTYYGVHVFSEPHWQLIEAYVRTAVKNGINLLLTPLFTPPLDTEVGKERPTVQLIEVNVTEAGYAFGFGLLTRWFEMGRRCGVRYYEFSHLFTQWGAKHAPKIIGNVDGKEKLLFGWETDASGEEYRRFLGQFLTELVRYLKDHDMEDRCYFHISDEPHFEHLEAYGQAARTMEAYLGGLPRIDALSDYAFYEKGLVPTPIPATSHIEPFLVSNVPNLWTYYCNSQYHGVSNRFFSYSSARNRIIGFQLYKFDITGFLHWGFNFWYSRLSKRAVDPYRVTDCDLAYPSGDAFVVYPGKEGPVESLRLAVFSEALQDLRALRLLERLIGREDTLKMLEEDLDTPLSFADFPRSGSWLLTKREQINQAIAAAANQEANHE